ncbi:MAG: DUF4358 domain-containing protein [Clostridia bacterium]|nr:DUF4358 domain-containing protein [Clostridia bacterium]
MKGNGGSSSASGVSSSSVQDGNVPEKIVNEIKEKCKLSGMTELSKEQLFSRYGISEEYVMYSAVLVSGDSLSKDEVIVIKAMDEGSACSVRDCLDKYYDSVLKESKEYLPDEYEKLEKASVVKDGIYVRLFVSDDAAKMDEIYNSYEK